MIRLEISTANAETFFQLVQDTLEPRVLLALIGARFLSYADESFRTNGRGKWKPLSQLTLLLRKHGGNQPLQDSGRYKQSFVQVSDHQTYVEVGTNLKTGTGLSLGRIHEFGTGPYTIRAQKAHGLAAQTRAGAWLHFGKEVRHPGIPARPVLPPKAVAERLAKETLEAILSRVQASKGG